MELQYRKQLITPEMAKEHLAKAAGFINRRVTKERIDSYAADMASGAWRLNGEPVIFDEDGILIDGQHRMLAIVKIGIPVALMTCHGVVRDAAETIDQGLSRTVSGALHMEGVSGASRVCAAARTLHELRGGVDPSCETGQRHAPGFTLKTVSELKTFLLDHAAGLVDMLGLIPPAVCKVAAVSEIAAAAYEFSLVDCHENAIDWVNGLLGGLPLKDPRQALRERFLDDRVAISERRVANRTVARARDQRLSLMVQGWNLFVGGHEAGRACFTLSGDREHKIMVPLSESQARGRPVDQINRSTMVNLRGYRRLDERRATS